jgi:predicted ATP-grasp superfamily ATP-dependent carboligase
MISGNHPELIALGRKLFEGMGYNGVGSIEFKKDDRDGQYKLIELNPRFWQQNIQATYAGVNFPYINYLDCIGEKIDPVLSFKEDIRFWDAYPDVQSFLANRKRGDVSFFEWFKSILSADCHAHFAWDELLYRVFRFVFYRK